MATSSQPRKIVRAEAVGSLLRPDAVSTRLDRIFADRTSGLKSLLPVEQALDVADIDLAIDIEVKRLVQRQIDSGLDVVTDGELRRSSFLGSFQEGVDGLVEPDQRLFVRNEAGELVYTTFGQPIIVKPLTKSGSPLALEAGFLRAVTDFPFKVTLPTPSYFYTEFVPFAEGVYQRDREDLIADVIAIQKRLVAEAIAAGARYIQFDFPVYPGLVDDAYAGGLADRLGIDVKTLLERSIAADAAVTQSIPEGVTVGMHLCRGNVEGGFWNGSLEPIAEQMFAGLPHDRFLFEWEDRERDGDYAAIRHVAKGAVMAMGLVSTKHPELESDDEIVARIEEASQYLPIEQLALTTQCGFASFCGDHLVEAEDAQWRKLDLIGRVADRVWGR